MNSDKKEMLTLIIGKNSNFSLELKKSLPHVTVLSSVNIVKEFDRLKLDSTDVCNIIFNNFQMATALNDLSCPSEYIERSISATAQVLTYIKEHKINVNKMIYTSSSSVYGNNILCKEIDTLNPLSLHSSLKIANEKLIEAFAVENKIDYTISRIFNMYGGNDHFSIISKIKKFYLEDSGLTIANNGNALRDFIHIDDVVKIHKVLLSCTDINKINIGSGRNTSIGNIIDFLRNKNIFLKTKNILRDELKVSSADITVLLSIMGKMNFEKVEEFLLREIKKGKV